MINVCVNGYGTIGKRVSDAVRKHEKIKFIGASKYTPDGDARLANMLGVKLFVPAEKRKDFEAKGISVSGSVDEMIGASDIIVDASSDGNGMKNKATYIQKGKPALFQGGEEASIGTSFNARSNFDSCRGADYIRVVSCNTTAFCRLIKPLAENYKIKHIDAFLIRRGSDPNDAKGSALNSVEWKSKSHHADDVRTVIDVPVTSVAFKVPHTISHVNSMQIEFDEAPSKDDLYELYRKESRVALLNSASQSAQIMEAARDLGLKRYDTFVVSLLMNTFMSDRNKIFFSFSVPQESIVIPENVDAIISRSGLMTKKESMSLTDDVLGITKIKSDLEKVFG
jgi:glyceraldehyde-3-phosphate dehydrogenase (NAD(P))